MEKRTYHLVFLLLFAFISSKIYGQETKKKPAHVLITAGQSNTDGRVSNTLLPAYIKPWASDSLYVKGNYPFCKISQNDGSGTFVPFWPKGRITEGRWTYDAIVYYHFAQALQEDFYVVKWAVGGTSIGMPCDSAKGRYWYANPTWLSQTSAVEKGGKSLLLSFTDAIDAAIEQTLSQLEQGYQIDAFLWHQGESDDRFASNYYENLKQVVAYVRQHLTAVTGKDYSTLPFIFGSIPKANRHYQPLVEAGMQRIAEEDPNAYLINMGHMELQKDRTHFNEKAAEYLGQQMFKVLNQQIKLTPTEFRIADYQGDKRCAISYTFDDGLQEHYTLVNPRLNALGFRGTFWINGSKINPSADHVVDTTRTTWQNLREMARAGHEISNHGWAHRNFGRFSLEEIKQDVSQNDSVLYAEIGMQPLTFCYPNNTKTPEGFAFVNENRVGTRLLQRSLGGKSTSESLAQWVADLMESRGWGVGMTHGITYGYDKFSNPAIFWKHLQQVKAQEEKIWIGTFREVVAYIKERKYTTYDVEITQDGMMVTPHLTLDKTLFTEKLTGVIDRSGVKKVKIQQGEKILKPQLLPDKVLFDFDPYGGRIVMQIEAR